MAVKSWVLDNVTPKRIHKIEFSTFSPAEIVKLSEVQVVAPSYYTIENPEQPTPNGMLDPRMGGSSIRQTCATCGDKIIGDCPGHFGHIELKVPVFHTMFLAHILRNLKQICKYCSRVLLNVDEVPKFRLQLKQPGLDYADKMVIKKRILKACEKNARFPCSWCGKKNGDIRKMPPFKIYHYPFGASTKKELSELDEHEEFMERFNSLKATQDALVSALESKPCEDLTPARVKELFENIPTEEFALLDLDPRFGHPADLILTNLLVPPCTIRPSIPKEGGTSEDDITAKMKEIVTLNEAIQSSLFPSGDNEKTRIDVMTKFESIQNFVALYINSETPGIPKDQHQQRKIRGLCNRLGGKTGRFRGNLSGKRADYTSRTVISPDPNLQIFQVGIPIDVAKRLTFPERITRFNINKMRKLVRNGVSVHPGAIQITSPSGKKKRLGTLAPTYLQKAAQELQIGDIVERHMMDNDIVLFNRQPSLHRISIMAHQAKILPWKTFRFNECVCQPYNADFDGDEMNVHLPQTLEARAEAYTLMLSMENLATPKSGELLISATQDFLTGAYLLTDRDKFFDRAQVTQLCCFFSDANIKIVLPPPAIFKPVRLWTGKQIFSLLIKHGNDSPMLNMERSVKNYTGTGEVMCAKDGWAFFRNGQLLSGRLDKSILGAGKNTIFQILMRDYSPAVSADRMLKLAKLASRYVGEHGFSIGISDVTAGASIVKKMNELSDKTNKECEEFITQFKNGTLEETPGFTPEQTLEEKITKVLSDLRDEAGKMCISSLPRHNSPLIMCVCGSKGSNQNLAQMISLVGQQTVGGKRMQNGFVNRTLPHFKRFNQSTQSKGFVSNSFYTGLNPCEFFFHTVGGREGLVDTAVKTAETGYTQRKLVKGLEDLVVHYDGTVRTANHLSVVQFTYGQDRIDPMIMEGDSDPVDLKHLFIHVINQSAPDEEDALRMKSGELKKFVQSILRADPDIIGTMEDEDRKLFEAAENKLRMEQKGSLDHFNSEKKLSEKEKKFVDAIISTRDDFSEVPEKFKRNLVEFAVTAFLELPYPGSQYRITKKSLFEFFKLAGRKYRKAMVEPGTAVGAISAQSIGEPCTQMTLKTFHFAGLKSMNITLGVPRITEIINATKNIRAPFSTAQIAKPLDQHFAVSIKGKLERVKLGDVTDYMAEVYLPTGVYLVIKIDVDLLKKFNQNVTIEHIKQSILAPNRQLRVKLLPNNVLTAKPPGWLSSEKKNKNEKNLGGATYDQKIYIKVEAGKKDLNIFYVLQNLKLKLPHIVISGHPKISRVAVVAKEKKKKKDDKKEDPEYELVIEEVLSDHVEYPLSTVLATRGIDYISTLSNHPIEAEQVLGIEAARQTIVNQILYTMDSHNLKLDQRHLQLLADQMTYKGEILGINRFGIAKMKESMLMLASFERTTDFIFDAAAYTMSDNLNGVSESIIMGNPIPVGTGLFDVLLRPQDTPPKKNFMFEGAYNFNLSLKDIIS